MSQKVKRKTFCLNKLDQERRLIQIGQLSRTGTKVPKIREETRSSKHSISEQVQQCEGSQESRTISQVDQRCHLCLIHLHLSLIRLYSSVLVSHQSLIRLHSSALVSHSSALVFPLVCNISSNRCQATYLYINRFYIY